MLVLVQTPTGDLARLAEYRDEETCWAARRMVMEQSLYQAICIPIPAEGMLPGKADNR